MSSLPSFVPSSSSDHTHNTKGKRKIEFRSIKPNDFQVIKQLHEEFFPVRYSDSFYRDACRGIGLNNCPLFTCLAVNSLSQHNERNKIGKNQCNPEEEEEEVIGFIFAQFIPYADCEDQDIVQQPFPFNSRSRYNSNISNQQSNKMNSTNLYTNNDTTAVSLDDDEHNKHHSSYSTSNNNQHFNSSVISENNQKIPAAVPELLYILTLGVKPLYRRSGLASELLSLCTEHAKEQPQHAQCGAIYLHVIHNNPSAISFYQRNKFVFCKTVYDFYHINESYHNAFLYALYINGCQAPSPTMTSLIASTAMSVYHSIVQHISEAIVTMNSTVVNSLIHFLPIAMTLANRSIENDDDDDDDDDAVV